MVQKIIVEQKNKVIKSAVVSVIVTFVFSFWYFLSRQGFVWKDIDPLDAPLYYPLYSALVFIGPGAYLYYCTDFYKDLYRLLRKEFRARNLHRRIKRILWLLMAVTVFVIVSMVVYLLNVIISFIYNIAILTLYLAPPAIVALFGFAFGLIHFKRSCNNKPLSYEQK